MVPSPLERHRQQNKKRIHRRRIYLLLLAHMLACGSVEEDPGKVLLQLTREVEGPVVSKGQHGTGSELPPQGQQLLGRHLLFDKQLCMSLDLAEIV